MSRGTRPRTYTHTHLLTVVRKPFLVHFREVCLVLLEFLLDFGQLGGMGLQLRILLDDVLLRQPCALHAGLLHAHKDDTRAEHDHRCGVLGVGVNGNDPPDRREEKKKGGKKNTQNASRKAHPTAGRWPRHPAQ